MYPRYADSFLILQKGFIGLVLKSELF